MILDYLRQPPERAVAVAPSYRSRGEAQLATMLDRHDIPFIYERPTHVYDRGRHRTWHPDFTLPSHGDLIVEYAGMLDDPDYVSGIRHKLRAYQANGLPALFVCPMDLEGPNWALRIVERIEDTFWRYGHEPKR